MLINEKGKKINKHAPGKMHLAGAACLKKNQFLLSCRLHSGCNGAFLCLFPLFPVPRERLYTSFDAVPAPYRLLPLPFTHKLFIFHNQLKLALRRHSSHEVPINLSKYTFEPPRFQAKSYHFGPLLGDDVPLDKTNLKLSTFTAKISSRKTCFSLLCTMNCSLLVRVDVWLFSLHETRREHNTCEPFAWLLRLAQRSVVWWPEKERDLQWSLRIFPPHSHTFIRSANHPTFWFGNEAFHHDENKFSPQTIFSLFTRIRSGIPSFTCRFRGLLANAPWKNHETHHFGCFC